MFLTCHPFIEGFFYLIIGQWLMKLSIGMDGDEVREDDNDREGSDAEGDGGEDDGQGKAEYVKKEFVARPYASPWNTDTDVKNLIIKNSR